MKSKDFGDFKKFEKFARSYSRAFPWQSFASFFVAKNEADRLLRGTAEFSASRSIG